MLLLPAVLVALESAGDTAKLADLGKRIAMHIAAADPQFIRREDVPVAVLDKEKDIQKARVINEGKPEKVAEKIVEGRIGKYYEEVCLYEQPFVKENTISIDQLIKSKIAKLGENIAIARFARFKVGDTATE